MKTNLPVIEENIVVGKTTEKNWYDFFTDIYNKTIGYFDSSLLATLHKDTAEEGNVDGTETDIDSFIIKHANLTSNEVIDIILFGTYAGNGNNKTIRLKINSSTYYTKTVSTSGGSWIVKAKIINLGTSQKIIIDNGSYIYTTTSIDTSTTDFNLILTLQGVATDDIIKEYLEIRFDK